ncbi:hypothetical protein C8R47DRAFT_1200893 [Mycena vitilis]|nr:hypothetical protein C8R47DRAFT_1200893 [Mycena vitilis]
MSIELPNELWLRIFQYLPRFAIPIIHRVSTSFAVLSYGLLFEEFHFQPRPRFPQQSATLAPKDVDKLAFWTSEKIIPHVRRCTVVLQTVSSLVFQFDSPSPFVAALVQGISRFSNVQNISFKFRPAVGKVEIAGLRVDGLTNLRSLELDAARLICPTQPPPRMLNLEHFSYTHIPRLMSLHTPSYLSFLDPDALHHLTLGSDNMQNISILADPTVLSSFHNLHVLELRCMGATVTALHAYISPLSSLRELRINMDLLHQAQRVPSPATVRPLTLPQLRRYDGPAALLPLVLPGTTLHSITLQHDAESAPQMCCADFSALPSAGTLLPDILARIPRLATLTLTIWCDCPLSAKLHADSHAFSERLGGLLSSSKTLQSVELQWWFPQTEAYSRFHLTPRREKTTLESRFRLMPCLEDVEMALSAAIPSLRHVSCFHFVDGGFKRLICAPFEQKRHRLYCEAHGHTDTNQKMLSCAPLQGTSTGVAPSVWEPPSDGGSTHRMRPRRGRTYRRLPLVQGRHAMGGKWVKKGWGCERWYGTRYGWAQRGGGRRRMRCCGGGELIEGEAVCLTAEDGSRRNGGCLAEPQERRGLRSNLISGISGDETTPAECRLSA